jgi:deoxyribodipyrimidine photo-lyase
MGDWDRVRPLNDAVFNAKKRYVLYWAQVNRRVESNHALAFAADLANEHNLPLLFYEGLTCSYPHANDRLHTFVLQGVPETERRLAAMGIGYVFHLRRRKSELGDALYRLAADAGAVVADDFPTFTPDRFNRIVPGKLFIPYYAVDGSCIVPMGRFDKQEYAANTIRPKIRRMLYEYLQRVPPIRMIKRYREATSRIHTPVTEANIAVLVGSSQIDHSVPPCKEFHGGRRAAELRLKHFLKNGLRRYGAHRNKPSARVTSELSPYLHFGHISSLEVALAVRDYAAEHNFIPDEFLEELIVRRELAFNFARFAPKQDSLESLPEWARVTLLKHARDRRSWVYTRSQFERAETHDALWNATQREMLQRGKIHGYYRMYWGKKIIEWSASHKEALDTMIYIHNQYALDGRDPNTYANILWCFGLHDRPWGERPVFGTVRYISLEGMRRKTDVDAYIHGVA